MPTEKNQFEDIQQTYLEWPVYTGGYYWDDTVSVAHSFIGASDEPARDHFSTSPFLLQRAGTEPQAAKYLDDDHEVTWIRPIEDYPELFKTFAETPATRKCILDFANKYGTLTLLICYVNNISEIKSSTMFRYLDDKNQELTVRGESFRLWDTEIQRMRWAIQLWDWLRKNDDESLQKLFFLEDGREFHKRHGCLAPTDEERFENDYVDYWDVPYSNSADLRIYYVLVDKDIYEQFSSAEEILDKAKDKSFDFHVGTIGPPFPGVFTINHLNAGQFLLQNMINEQLGDSAVRPVLMQGEDGRLKLYLQPFDLLAAMWVEFALEVTGQKDFKRCTVCGAWEDVTNKRSNWTKHESCANAARVQRYRQRQQVEEPKKQVRNKPARKPADKPKSGVVKKAAKTTAGNKATVKKAVE